MDCPKCNAGMQEVKYGGVTVDRCTRCMGIWFDFSEHEDLKAMEGSESIDIGSTKVGKKNNEIGDITCPRCDTKMIKMVYLDQHHIWYEACQSCYGVYFDAGEFKDYKQEDFLDKIKDFFTPGRQ
jgi:Zn-finger nucleic acid-binding protein